MYDPATTRQEAGRWVRDPFPGNRVPSARFDPVAVKVIDLYPQTNLGTDAVNNSFFSGSRSDDTNQLDTRGDHSLNSNHRIFGRYSRRTYDFVDPGSLPLPADGGLWTTTTLTSHSVVGNLNSTLSPSMNNELRAGYSRVQSTLDVPWTENYNQKLGIQGLPDLGDDNQRGMTRFTPAGYSEVGTRSFWPNRNNLDFFQITDHVMKVSGRHVMKAGVEFRREQIFRRAARFARGQMGFNGAFTQNPNDRARTGDGMADFLLGLANAGNLGNQNGETAVTLNYSAFFQDDWKIGRHMTLNLGVRWDRFGPPSFRNTPVSRFVFTPGTQQYQIVRPDGDGDCGCDPDDNNFAPRIGLAWQLNPKTVVRSGFGLYYGQPDAISHDGDGRFANLPPEFTEIGFPTDQLLSPALIVKNGFPPGLLPTTVVRENVTVKTASPYMPSQYAMQWFADVQRQIPGSAVVTISYIGVGTRHMVWTRNLNQPLVPAPGAIKNNRPYPFFGGITYRDSGGRASYQALTAKAEKRYSAGVTFLASYTWAHSIDDGAGTLDDGTAGGGTRDNYNMRFMRGNSAYDIRQNFVFSGVWDLPFGKGRRYLNVSGPADWILGGWQLGGIMSLRTGRPFSATINGDLTNTGTTNYPNRLASGELPEAQRTIDKWFNIAAFAPAPQYVYGNSGRNILYGPGYASADLKIGKNWFFYERYRVEYRAEMFNFTNTPNFGLPAAAVNLAQAGQIRSSYEPRRIQMGLKLVF